MHRRSIVLSVYNLFTNFRTNKKFFAKKDDAPDESTGADRKSKDSKGSARSRKRTSPRRTNRARVEGSYFQLSFVAELHEKCTSHTVGTNHGIRFDFKCPTLCFL